MSENQNQQPAAEAQPTVSKKDQAIAWVKANKSKIGLVALVAVLVAIALFGGYQVYSAKKQANKAVAIAVQVSSDLDVVDGRVGNLEDRADASEQEISGLVGANVALNNRLDLVEKATTAVGKTANAAKSTAESAVARQNARVRAENQSYKRMIAYIKGANPASELAKLSDADVERKLNDGQWNIEPLIQAEYDALISATANAARTAAAVANEEIRQVNGRVDVVRDTANQALVAGETGVAAAATIAEQPNRPLGRSVSKATKRSISAQVSAYYESYGAGPEIIAGAPEE